MRSLPLVLASLAAATVLTPARRRTPPTAQRDEVTGTPAADDLKGTNGEDVVRGLGGNDAIDGRKGHDVLVGGAGDDSITDWLGHRRPEGRRSRRHLPGRHRQRHPLRRSRRHGLRRGGRRPRQRLLPRRGRRRALRPRQGRAGRQRGPPRPPDRPVREDPGQVRGVERQGMSFPFYDDPHRYPPDVYHGRRRRGVGLDPAERRPRDRVRPRRKLRVPPHRSAVGGQARHLPLDVRRARERPGRPLPQVDRRAVLRPRGRGPALRRRRLAGGRRGRLPLRARGRPARLQGWQPREHAADVHAGAPREDYFETLAALGRGGTMTDEERAEFMLRHDTYWVDD